MSGEWELVDGMTKGVDWGKMVESVGMVGVGCEVVSGVGIEKLV